MSKQFLIKSVLLMIIKPFLMGQAKIILLLLLLIVVPVLSLADDFIYDKPYGGKKVGRTDDKGFIYDKPYGGKKIGRVEKGTVYDKPYGGKKVGRIEDNGKLYDKPYGGTSVGRHRGGRWFLEQLNIALYIW